MTNEETTEKEPPMKRASDEIASVASDLRAAVTQKFGDTVNEGRLQADHAKANVAGEVKNVAMSLRRASEEMRGGSPQERTIGQIATSLADASDALRNKDMGEILQAASKIARDNPALFLGGAALLGFAASRYAKASASHATKSASQHSSDRTAEVDAYVSEGNPNTQPAAAAP
jgi:hypothetical protein